MINMRKSEFFGEWMRSEFYPSFIALAVAVGLVALPSSLMAQKNSADFALVKADELPDAPGPQFTLNAPGLALDATAQHDQGRLTQSSSSLQPDPLQAEQDQDKDQREKAEQQLKLQEHQRVAGVMATFNTTTNRNAVPLSSKQKFELFFHSETDPWPFFLAGVVSGIGQADDSYPEWGQGAQGYAKRFGAAYSDAFIGNFFGNAVLTTLLREDPRYFQKGTGSAKSRFWWAAASTVWCRRDNGEWGPNYANVGGNLIGAAIARAYYPASERTVSDAITDGLTVSVEGIVGAEVIEFWPDLARHMKRKHEEKLAREAAKRDAENAGRSTSQPAATRKP